MKVVVLTATGRPADKSNTLFVVRELLAHLPQAKVQLFNAQKMKFAACQDCGWCHSHPACCLQDEMTPVYAALNEAQLVVVASPMVFGTLAGDLLRLFSRLAILYGHHVQGLAHPFAPKQAVFVVTAGQDWLNMFLPCEAVYPIMLSHLNAEESGRLYARKTNFTHVGQQVDFLPLLEQQCQEIAACVQRKAAGG